MVFVHQKKYGTKTSWENQRASDELSTQTPLTTYDLHTGCVPCCSFLMEAGASGKLREGWTKKCDHQLKGHPLVRLIEDILHQLRYIKAYKYWDIYHINWCRISSINSMQYEMSEFFFWKKHETWTKPECNWSQPCWKTFWSPRLKPC